MIRRKVSNGLLRATKSNGSLRSTAAAQAHVISIPATQQQTAGLASATLLSSQRNWGNETVVTLKTELKKRRLSQTGNKTALIDRLSSANTSALLPPILSLPKSTISAPPSSFNKVRNLSTTSARTAPPPKHPSPPPPRPKNEPVADDKVTSTGPSVVTKQTEAPKRVPVAPEEVTVAPGLPETKNTGKTKKQTLDVKMPRPEAEKENDQFIPTEPDNFRSARPTQSSASESSTTPKVMTVASAATHPGGGPTHATHDATDATSLESAAEQPNPSIPLHSSVVSSAWGATGKAFSTAGLSSTLPEVGAPKFNGGSEYKASKQGLSGEERRGLWVLGGIVGLGLLLGGPSKKKGKTLDLHVSIGPKDGKGAKGVKGDAQREKASGAGVVGHGSRKDQ